MTDQPKFVSKLPITTITEQLAKVNLAIVSTVEPHGDWCRCTSCRRLDDVHAELVELRALKAKVDSVVVHGADAIVYLPGQKLPIAYAGTLIEWLRETTDG